MRIFDVAVGAGWLAAIASLPVAVALLGLSRTDLRFDPAWPALIASIASALIIWRVGKRPGTLSTLDAVTDKPDAL